MFYHRIFKIGFFQKYGIEKVNTALFKTELIGLHKYLTSCSKADFFFL